MLNYKIIKKHNSYISGELTFFNNYKNEIIVGSDDTTVRFYEIVDNAILEKKLFSKHIDKISSVDYNGKLAISGSFDNIAYFYDTSDNKIIDTVFFSEPISHCRIISDNIFLVAAGSSWQIRQVGVNDPLLNIYTPGGLKLLEKSNDTNFIAIVTVTNNQEINIFKTSTGEKLSTIKCNRKLKKIKFDVDENLWSLDDKQLRLWNLKGTIVDNIGSSEKILDFSLTKKTITVAKDNGSIVIINRKPLKIVSKFEIEQKLTKILALDDENYLVFCTIYSNLVLLNKNTGEVINQLNRSFSIPRSMTIKNNESICILHLNGELINFTKEEIAKIWKTKIPQTTTSMTLSDDNKLIVGTTVGKIYQIDEKGNYNILFDVENTIWDLVEYNNDLFIALGSPANSIIKIVNLDWESRIEKKIHENSILSLDVSKSGIITGSLDRTIRWLNLDLEEKHKETIKSSIWSVSWAKSSHPIPIIGSSDGLLRKYNFATDEVIIKPAHSHTINTIVSYQDKIATGSSDKTLKIWNANDLSEISSLVSDAAIVKAMWYKDTLFAIDYIGTIYSLII